MALALLTHYSKCLNRLNPQKAMAHRAHRCPSLSQLVVSEYTDPGTHLQWSNEVLQKKSVVKLFIFLTLGLILPSSNCQCAKTDLQTGHVWIPALSRRIKQGSQKRWSHWSRIDGLWSNAKHMGHNNSLSIATSASDCPSSECLSLDCWSSILSNRIIYFHWTNFQDKILLLVIDD